jgi:hypothetical protein
MRCQRPEPSRLMAASVEVEASERADREIDAQDDFARHFEQVEMLVEDVERKMQDGVACACDAQRAPRQDDAGIIEDALRRRDRQRDQQKPQRPVAGLVDGLGHRARAEFIGGGLIGDPKRRQHRRHEGDDLHRRPAPGPLAKKWHGSSLSSDAKIQASGITPNQMRRARGQPRSRFAEGRGRRFGHPRAIRHPRSDPSHRIG